MNSTILGMLAETSIHPGSGQDAGFVDLPVAREAATDYPVIVGSSLKGALLDRAREAEWGELKKKRVFGEQETAGQLLVGDARLLLLPVRSLQGSYKWVSCPHLLDRFQRDIARMRNEKPVPSDSIDVESGKYRGAGEQSLFLEERQFETASDLAIAREIAEPIGQLMLSMSENIPKRLVILNDDDFAWFARYGLAVNARNALHTEKKTSKNLWYEETIPPDALFYCLIAQRNQSGALEDLLELFQQRPYLQVGGNETVGQGWFAVKPLESGQTVGGAA